MKPLVWQVKSPTTTRFHGFCPASAAHPRDFHGRGPWRSLNASRSSASSWMRTCTMCHGRVEPMRGTPKGMVYP